MEDERILIQKLRARDESAFVELVERYYGHLLPLASFCVSSRAVAEEVVQDAWVAVLTGIDRFEERSSFKTWICRIVMNLARTRGVRESRMVPLAGVQLPKRLFFNDELESSEPAVDPARFQASNGDYPDHWSTAPRPWNADPEAQLLGSETMSVLDQAVGTLPEAQRLVLTLRDIQGLSAEEVCNILEISETNQRVLLHRARSKVRGILESHYSNSGRADRGGPFAHRWAGQRLCAGSDKSSAM